jgi:hypothetical protein
VCEGPDIVEVEENVEPLLLAVSKHERPGMHASASQICCFGPLLGVYRPERGSRSELRKWTADALLVSVKAAIDARKERSLGQADVCRIRELVSYALSGCVRRRI